MPQQVQTQALESGGATFTTGYASGTVCPRTGSYKSENKYMNAIVVVVAGAKFPNFLDGKKCTWLALSTTTAGTTADGGFESARVAPGAA